MASDSPSVSAPIELPPAPHELPLWRRQAEIVEAATDEDSPKHIIAIWGRGAGKTTAALQIILRAATSPSAARRLTVYCGPTVGQARKLIWEPLRNAFESQDGFLATGRRRAVNEARMEITLANEHRIWVIGADALGSQRGLSIHRLILDEFQECDERTWATLRPSLRTSAARAVVLGTPNGPDHFQARFDVVSTSPEWLAIRAPTWEAPHADVANLREAMATLDRHSFDQEYGAEFLAMRGAIYKDFSRDKHLAVRAHVRGREWLVGMDFNTAHHTMVMCQADGERLHVFGELVGRNGLEHSLESLGAWFTERGVDWRREVKICGDASSAFNSTNTRTAGQSDSIIVKRLGWNLKLERANPAVRERVHTVHALIRTGDGRTRLSLDPSCTYLVRCLESQEWSRFGAPDKARGLDHGPDALGYVGWYVRPIRAERVFRVV